MKQKIKKSKIKERQQPVQKIEKPVAEYLPEFNLYIEKYGFYVLLFLLAIMSFIIFKDFILLDKIYLYKDIGSDSINANYPHGFQIANYMQQESFIPKWSFYQGMGQNILPFSISDPYYLILMLFGPNNLAYGIGYMEIAKIFSAGILFYLFLKTLNFSAYAAITGSLLYAFSGFVILGSCWTIFSTEAVYMAFLLYAFEKFYKENKIIFIPIAICLISVHQPFDLFLIGLFLFAYILFRYLQDNNFNFKKVGFLLLKVAGLSALGVLMSTFFLIPNIIQMLESPRVSGDSSFFSKLMSFPAFSLESKLHNVTALMRFFSNDMVGTGTEFRGWYNYLEAPMFYCGVINFLLIPQLFRFLNAKKRLIFSVFIFLFLMPVLFPFFRYAFWAFTGDYYRLFSFFISIIFLLFTVNALHQLNSNFKISPLILGISISVLLIILNYNYLPGTEIINSGIRIKVTLFLVLYSILLFLLNLKRYRSIIKSGILFLVLIELISFSSDTVNRPVITGDELHQKTGFGDYSNDAIDYLKAQDKSFYRVTKDYASGPAMHSSLNDAQVQKFYGTPSYTSFNQLNYIKFLQEAGIINGNDETATRWARGLSEVPILHPFGGVKYGLSKTNNSFLLGFNYDSLTTIGDVRVLRNRVSLPLGFTYSKFISRKNFKLLSNNQKWFTLYKAVVVDDSLYSNFNKLPVFPISDTSLNYTWDELASDANMLKKDSLKIDFFSQNLIKGKINSTQPQFLFFSIPFDKGWKAKIDGKETEPMIINIGFTGIFLDKGEHQVELLFIPRYYSLGAIISVIAIFLFAVVMIIKKMLDKKRRVANGIN